MTAWYCIYSKRKKRKTRTCLWCCTLETAQLTIICYSPIATTPQHCLPTRHLSMHSSNQHIAHPQLGWCLNFDIALSADASVLYRCSWWISKTVRCPFLCKGISHMTGAFMELHTVNVSSCWRCPDCTLCGQSLRELSACQPTTVQVVTLTLPVLTTDPSTASMCFVALLMHMAIKKITV